MSVASTRDEDVEAAAAYLPDRPISPHINLVTPDGLRALDAALASARAAYNAAQTTGTVQADRTAMAQAARDLKYYAARRASAQLVRPEPIASGVVLFGYEITFSRADGRRQTFRIVGEDEADAARGSVSHVSPLARALLGKAVGDTAVVAGGDVEILDIRGPAQSPEAAFHRKGERPADDERIDFRPPARIGKAGQKKPWRRTKADDFL